MRPAARRPNRRAPLKPVRLTAPFAWLAAGLLAGACWCAPSRAAPARLAVVARRPDVADTADVLTAELSKQPGLSLLERDQIQKIYSEQSLAAGSEADCLKLGKILGADGLLLLNLVRQGNQPFLDVQLVAVKPGVLLSSQRFPWPLENTTEWAGGLARHLRPLWPKLTVLRRDAVAISVVGLRSAAQSRQARELERQLTLLATERLSREKRLFVLERRHMRRLLAEQKFDGLNDSAFWSGSYLLDGTVDREGYSAPTVTINAWLTPAKGGAPLSFQVSGSRTNLAEVINRFTAKVLETLKLRAAARPWNAAAEASQYFDEAKWAYQWRLLSLAAADCEVSWALGKQTKAVAALRIQSYYENGVDRAAANYDLSHKLVTFAPGVPPERGSFPVGYESFADDDVPPDGARFARVRRAMELFCADFRTLIAPDPNPGWAWHDLGIDLLQGSSYWLRHYYYMPEARRGQEDAIAEVQSLDWEIAGLLEQERAFTNDFGRGRSATTLVNWGYAPAGETYRDQPSLLETEVNWGAYWAATPEQGIELYRRIIQRGLMPRVRRLFVTPDFLERSSANPSAGTPEMMATAFDPALPTSGGPLPTPGVLTYLTGWTWPARQRAPVVWQEFMAELCASTNPLVKVEGLFLRCAQAPTDPRFDQDFRQFVDFLRDHWDTLAAAREDSGLLADIDLLMGRRWRPGYTAAAGEREQLWDNFKQEMAARQASFAKRTKLEQMTAYLAGGSYDFLKFNGLFSSFDYQPADARLLLPALDGYRTRLTTQVQALASQEARLTASNDWTALAPVMREKGQLASAFFWIDRLQQTLESKLNPAPSPLPKPAGAPGAGLTQATPPPPGSLNHAPGLLARPPVPRVRSGRRPPLLAGRSFPPDFPPGLKPPPGYGVSQGTDPASLRLTNVLEVGRFWPLPDRLAGAQERSQLSISSGCYREGQLWLDVRAIRAGTYLGQTSYANHGAIYAIDLDTFQSKPIALDPRSFDLSPVAMFNSLAGEVGRTFEVAGGWVYVGAINAVRRYSLQNHTWETLPVPIQGQARIEAVDHRIFLSTENSIIEVSSAGLSVRILASNRRRPPETVLDSGPACGYAPLVEGPNGSLTAFVGGKFYQRPRGGSDWKLLPEAPELPGASCRAFDSGLLISWRPYGRNAELFALFKGSALPTLLVSQSPARPPRVIYPGRQTTPSGSARPLWPLPDGVRVMDYPVCLDGDRLWVLAGAFDLQGAPGRMALRYPNGRSAVLFCLQKGETKPLAVPVKFELPADAAIARRLAWTPLTSLLFEPTPKGLIVANSRIPGFWLIPRADLAARRQRLATSSSRNGRSLSNR